MNWDELRLIWGRGCRKFSLCATSWYHKIISLLSRIPSPQLSLEQDSDLCDTALSKSGNQTQHFHQLFFVTLPMSHGFTRSAWNDRPIKAASHFCGIVVDLPMSRSTHFVNCEPSIGILMVNMVIWCYLQPLAIFHFPPALFLKSG